MVEFFNKKEEVMDLQLTEYGKYLLSLGRFKPEFYAFYDDDILYNSQCAGFVERQNDTDGRIKNDTPSLKIVSQITSAEARVNKFVNNVSASYANSAFLASLDDPTAGTGISQPSSASSDIAFAFDQQPFEEKANFLTEPLGNSSISKSHAPAWSISVPTNEISSSTDYITVRNSEFDGGNETFVAGPVQHIPQIDIEIDYKVFPRSGDYTFDAISEYLNADVFLAWDTDYLLLDILEENTDYVKENFEIEVFHSGSLPAGVSGLNYALTPPDSKPPTAMSFIKDGSIVTPQSLDNNDNAVPNVEYYMDVLVDKEIPQNILQAAGALASAVSRTSTRLNLARDLYTTENEEPCD
tara:strand:+ start:3363 stop:4424 length:1062 start_codon:yes stop_codon:yes gene_type:complete